MCLIAAFYLVEIVRFLKPLFDLIWFGNIVPLCTNIARIILYIGIIIAAFFVGKKYFPGVQFKQRGEEYSLKRLLLIYGITVGIVFIVTACLNFKIKIVHDLGENIAGPTASTTKLWEECCELFKQEREKGGVLDMDTRVVSTITSHGAGYIDKDNEVKYEQRYSYSKYK